MVRPRVPGKGRAAVEESEGPELACPSRDLHLFTWSGFRFPVMRRIPSSQWSLDVRHEKHATGCTNLE